MTPGLILTFQGLALSSVCLFRYVWSSNFKIFILKPAVKAWFQCSPKLVFGPKFSKLRDGIGLNPHIQMRGAEPGR